MRFQHNSALSTIEFETFDDAVAWLNENAGAWFLRWHRFRDCWQIGNDEHEYDVSDRDPMIPLHILARVVDHDLANATPTPPATDDGAG